MARGQDTRYDPRRQIMPGHVVHVPGVGPTTVSSVDKRYFTGTTSEGKPVGKTGLGLIEASGTQPAWQVDDETGVDYANRTGKAMPEGFQPTADRRGFTDGKGMTIYPESPSAKQTRVHDQLRRYA